MLPCLYLKNTNKQTKNVFFQTLTFRFQLLLSASSVSCRPDQPAKTKTNSNNNNQFYFKHRWWNLDKFNNNARWNMYKDKHGLITHLNAEVFTQGGAACKNTQAQGRTRNGVCVAHVLISRRSLRETRQERWYTAKWRSPHPRRATLLLRATEYGLGRLLAS